MSTASILGSWQFWAILSAVCAALTALFAKIGVTAIPSDVATLLRTIVILAALLLFLAFTGQLGFRLAELSRRSLSFLALSGLAAAASWVAYFRALNLGEVSRVAPIDRLSVVLVAVLAMIALGERLTIVNWLGVALSVLAAFLVTLP